MQYIGLIIPIVLGAIALIITQIYCSNKKKYSDFVEQHSIAIKELNELNKQFVFAPIGKCNIEHHYDNEAFFDTISTTDYLTYWLVFNQKQVLTDIKNARQNLDLFNRYMHQVNTLNLNRYDAPEIPPNAEKLLSIVK